MDKTTNIRFYGYENEIDNIFKRCHNRFNLWRDIPRYENERLKSIYFSELFKVLLRTYYNRKVCIYSDDDDYFMTYLYYDLEKDILCFQDVYEVYDDFEDEYILKERIYCDERLNKEEIDKVLYDTSADRFSFSNVFDAKHGYMHKNTRGLNIENHIYKLCYNYVSRIIPDLNRYWSVQCYTRELVMYIIDTACEEDNEFKVFVLYNMLFNIDVFFEYIDTIKNKVIQANGFIVECSDSNYSLNKKLLMRSGENELNFIDNERNLTVSTLNSKILGKLKKYICDKKIGDVCIIEKDRFIQSDIDQITIEEGQISLKNPLLFYSYKIEAELARRCDNITRNYQDKIVSLTRTNIMLYDVILTPKVYSPTKKYTLEVGFSFVKTPRMQYLIDFEDEVLTASDIDNLPICINYMKITDEKYKEVEFKEA